MKSSLLYATCYFAGHGATASLIDLTSILRGRSLVSDVEQLFIVRSNGQSLESRQSDLVHSSSSKDTATFPKLIRRTGKSASTPKGSGSPSLSPSPKGSSSGSGPSSPSISRSTSNASDKLQGLPKGTSPKNRPLVLGNSQLSSPTSPKPAYRTITSPRQPRIRLGTSMRPVGSTGSLLSFPRSRTISAPNLLLSNRMGSSASLATSSPSSPKADDGIHDKSLATIPTSNSVAGLSRSNSGAYGTVVAKGAATLRRQEGDNPGEIAKLKAGEEGGLVAKHPSSIIIGGDAGRSRSPSPTRELVKFGKTLPPERPKSEVVGYAKGDVIEVATDLTKGGHGYIEDRGGSAISQTAAGYTKTLIPLGKKTTQIFKAAHGSTTRANVKVHVHEPASFDMGATMVPPGEDRKKFLAGV